jgi:hypothetical protein
LISIQYFNRIRTVQRTIRVEGRDSLVVKEKQKKLNAAMQSQDDSELHSAIAGLTVGFLESEIETICCAGESSADKIPKKSRIENAKSSKIDNKENDSGGYQTLREKGRHEEECNVLEEQKEGIRQSTSSNSSTGYRSVSSSLLLLDGFDDSSRYVSVRQSVLP